MRGVHSLSGHVRYAILLSAIYCATVAASSRAEAACLPAPASVSGPIGTVGDDRPTFSWAAVPDAQAYTLYILTIPEETIVVRAIGITGTSFRPAQPLPTNHDMRWKVKAEGACGAGAYADGQPFRVVPASCPSPHERVTLIGPSGTIKNRAPTFCWTAVPGADEYVIALLFEADDSFYVLGHADSTTETCINLGPLPVNAPMRWKVKTECDERYGDFSDQLHFTIAP